MFCQTLWWHLLKSSRKSVQVIKMFISMKCMKNYSLLQSRTKILLPLCTALLVLQYLVIQLRSLLRSSMSTTDRRRQIRQQFYFLANPLKHNIQQSYSVNMPKCRFRFCSEKTGYSHYTTDNLSPFNSKSGALNPVTGSHPDP